MVGLTEATASETYIYAVESTQSAMLYIYIIISEEPYTLQNMSVLYTKSSQSFMQLQ